MSVAPALGETGPEEAALGRFLAEAGPLILARLERVEGSAPREQGAYMLVGRDGFYGTIGGGFAEFDTIAHAQAMLAEDLAEDNRVIILGPDSGQCCGGRLTIAFHKVTEERAKALLDDVRLAEQGFRPVMLFGTGHVGKALARALSPLPLRVTAVETRPEELEGLPENVKTIATPLPEAELRRLGPGGAVIILTHDHALDFLIAREALQMEGLAYVGMIGSKTKRASFSGMWKRDGGDPATLDKLVMPIGGDHVKDKRPAVIAAMVAAEILGLPPFIAPSVKNRLGKAGQA